MRNNTLCKMINKPAANLSQKAFKMKFGSFNLTIFSFWNTIFCILLLIDNNFQKSSGQNKNAFILVYMFLVVALSIFSLIFYYKMKYVEMFFKKRISHESIMAIFYLLILLFSYIFLLTLNSRDEKFQLIQSFATLLIMKNLVFHFLTSRKIQIFLIIFFLFFWTFFLGSSSSYEDSMFAGKLIIQCFSNLSIIIMYLFYSEYLDERKFLKVKMKKTKKVSRIKTEAAQNTSFEDNSILLKFLNSLNSGILLFDEEMNLLLFNKKMKKYLHRNTSLFKNSYDEKADYIIDKEEFLNCVNKLHDLKFISPFEQGNNQDLTEDVFFIFKLKIVYF